MGAHAPRLQFGDTDGFLAAVLATMMGAHQGPAADMHRNTSLKKDGFLDASDGSAPGARGRHAQKRQPGCRSPKPAPRLQAGCRLPRGAGSLTGAALSRPRALCGPPAAGAPARTEGHATQGFDHAKKGFDHAKKGFDHAKKGFDHAAKGFDHAKKGFDHAAKEFCSETRNSGEGRPAEPLTTQGLDQRHATAARAEGTPAPLQFGNVLVNKAQTSHHAQLRKRWSV